LIRTTTLALALTAGNAVVAAEPPVDLSNPGVRGRLWRMVPPEYPEEALARKQTGVLTVEGMVGPSGFATNYKFIPDRPESRIFAEALAKTGTFSWIYLPSLDGECQPVEEVVRTQLSFEIDNGTPRIFAIHASAPKGPQREQPPHVKPVSQPLPEYPEYAWKINFWANTFAKVTVDRAGNVIAVNARSYARNDRIKDLTPFNEAVEAALKQWKFPPAPAEANAPWTGCYEFAFRRYRDSRR